jgi:hypothetical protein
MILFDACGWLHSSRTVHFSEILITLKLSMTSLLVCNGLRDLVNSVVLGLIQKQHGFIQTNLIQNIILVIVCGWWLSWLDCLFIRAKFRLLTVLNNIINLMFLINFDVSFSLQSKILKFHLFILFLFKVFLVLVYKRILKNRILYTSIHPNPVSWFHSISFGLDWFHRL